MAGLLLLGSKRWPSITIAVFGLALYSGFSYTSAVLMAVGYTLEGVLAAALIRPAFHPRVPRLSVSAVKRLALAAAVAPAIASLVGNAETTLAQGLSSKWYLIQLGMDYGSNALGIIVVTPLLLTWSSPRAAFAAFAGKRVSSGAWVAAFLTCLVIVGLYVPASIYLLLVPFPLLLLSALRLQTAGVSVTNLALGVLVIANTWSHASPFASGDPLSTAAFCMTTLALLCLTSLALSSAIEAQQSSSSDLEVNSSRYRSLFEQSSDGVLVVTIEGTILEANEAFRAMLGYTQEELEGKPMSMLLPEAELSSMKEHLDHLQAHGAAQRQVRSLHKDGSLHSLLFSCVRVHDASQGALLCIARDVTSWEENAAKRALEAKLQVYSENVSSAIRESKSLDEGLGRCAAETIRTLQAGLTRIWTLDEDGETLTLRANVGAHAEEKDKFRKLRVGEGGAGRVAETCEVYATDSIGEDTIVRGGEKCIEAGLSAFVGLPLLVGERLVGVMAMASKAPFEQRTIQALQSVAEGIATGIDHWRAGRALAKNRALFEAIAEQSRDGIAVANSSSRLVFVNDGCCSMTGYDRESLIGAHLRMVFPECPDPTLFPDALSGTPTRKVLDFHREGGSRISVDCALSPIQIEEEQFVLCLFRDVTAELESRRQASELEGRRQNLQRLESVGLLAGGIAHDFNNLLLVILGHTDLALLRLGEGRPQVEQSLVKIQSAAEHAAALTKQLLAFGRRQPLDRENVEPNSIVLEAFEMLQRLLPENIETHFTPGANLGSLTVDATQLQQVLINLAINARDAMEESEGPKVLTLETSQLTIPSAEFETPPELRAGEYVCFTVRDTGMGMSEEVLDHMFEPFYTTKELGHGTGLGLATVYGVVKQHDGWIRCDSTVGEGTEFWLLFPCASSSTSQDSSDPCGPASTGSELILVAEDNAAVREMVTSILARAGYRVLEALDGADALELFKAHRDDIGLVLLDTVMPKLGGLDVRERILKQCPNARVLLTTGYNPIESTARPAEELADFLLKPYRPEALLTRIREALDVASAQTNNH